MQEVKSSRIIDVNQEKIWEMIGDVTTIDRWSTGVETVDLLSDEATGLHATRRCHFYDGTTVREEIVGVEDGHRVQIHLSEYTVPMKNFDAEFQLNPGTDGQTEVTFKMAYEMKMGFLGRIMGATMVRRQMTKIASTTLAGLEQFLLTGVPIGKPLVPNQHRVLSH